MLTCAHSDAASHFFRYAVALVSSADRTGMTPEEKAWIAPGLDPKYLAYAEKELQQDPQRYENTLAPYEPEAVDKMDMDRVLAEL